MRTLVFTAFSAVALCVALAACNGNSSNSVPTPSSTCGSNYTGQVALVNPAPGSTITAASQSQVTVAVSTPLPTTDNWTLIFSPDNNPNDGRETANSLFVVATPPPGSQTPTFANPIYYQVQLSSLLSTGTNNVFLDQPNTFCVPVGPFGSFTAQ